MVGITGRSGEPLCQDVVRDGFIEASNVCSNYVVALNRQRQLIELVPPFLRCHSSWPEDDPFPWQGGLD
jgi:hypothetical protein